jgi:MFS family permease
VSPEKFSGWRMVGIASLFTNIAMSFTFGVYGTFVTEIARQFPASRSVLSAGLALVMVMMGLLAPAVAAAIRRWSIRQVMMVGLLVLAADYALLSQARTAIQFVAIFGIVGGAAAAFTVFIPSVTLVNRWFVKHRGRATGAILAPLLLGIAPPLVAVSIGAYGWRVTALVMALVVLVTIPATRFLIDRPEDIGQRPLGDYAVRTGAPSLVTESATAPLLHSASFWIVTICGGIVNSASITMTTHIILLATAKGISFQSAAFLVSVQAAVGLLGGVTFGSLADRFGGALALALICAVEFLVWPSLLVSGHYWSLAALVGAVGLCATGLTPSLATLLAQLFGRENAGRAIGYYALIAMPFNFGMPLATGLLYDGFGSYRVAFLTYACLFGACATVLLSLHSKRSATPFGA